MARSKKKSERDLSHRWTAICLEKEPIIRSMISWVRTRKIIRGKDGFIFVVWAPPRRRCSVVGDFNNWDPDADPMKVLETSGIYRSIYPGLKRGELYKFAITTLVRQGII